MDAARFARQLVLPGFGPQAQQRLLEARVLVVGAGGLGSHVIPSLVAAGVGHLTIVDDDVVERSNLPRQTVHRAEDVGRGKAQSAADRALALAPDADVVVVAERIDTENALELIEAHDLVVDGSDLLETRYLVNDAAVLVERPVVWGSVSQYGGQVGLAWAERGPHYRDLFPEQPGDDDVLTCEAGGVLPTVVATVGSLMATEAIKVITGIGEPLLGRAIVLDALGATFDEIRYERIHDPADAHEDHGMSAAQLAYAQTPFPTRADDMPAQPRGITNGGGPGSAAAATSTRGAGMTDHDPTITARELAETSGHTLLDVRERWEYELAHLPGAVLIPLDQLPQRLDELDPERPVIAYCHHGVRSDQARLILERAGFDVRHLAGGIEAWSREVDPSVPQY